MPSVKGGGPAVPSVKEGACRAAADVMHTGFGGLRGGGWGQVWGQVRGQVW